MKIGILAWGSLQWDPRTLQISGDFLSGGPNLPIEFSRISGRTGPIQRLTLVIDELHSTVCSTVVATSSFNDLSQAREDLRGREGMHHVNGVGFIDRQTGDVSLRAMERHPGAVERIRGWLDGTDFDAVIWTALASNFKEVRREKYSIEAALSFLESLSAEGQGIALEYIRRAPTQTQTPLRNAVNQRWATSG